MLIATMPQGQSSGISGMQVLKPIQFIYFVGTIETDIEPSSINGSQVYSILKKCIVNVNHTSTVTGKTRQLVPMMPLSDLVEISTNEEGHADISFGTYTPEGGSSIRTTITFALPIRLSPDGAVSLNNNSYINIDFTVSQLVSVSAKLSRLSVYGIEAKSITSDRVILYNKYFVPVSETLRKFEVTSQKKVYFSYPNDMDVKNPLTQIVLATTDMAVPFYLPAELKCLGRLSNDLVSTSGAINLIKPGSAVTAPVMTWYGGSSLVGFSLVNNNNGMFTRQVSSMTIQTDGSSAYQFYTVDFYNLSTGEVVGNL